MFKTILIAALLITASSTAQAQNDPWQVVGQPSTYHTGDAGIRTLTQACQADFGPASRMSTSSEALDTLVWPTLTTQSWLRPSYVASGAGITDASGLNVGTSTTLSCAGWARSGSQYDTGLTLDEAGGFSAASQCHTARPVTCSVRVPEPTMASGLTLGLIKWCVTTNRSKHLRVSGNQLHKEHTQ